MLRILVVDDEKDVDTLTRQRFRKEIKSGLYHFDFAQDALMALKKLEENAHIDILVTDVNMPEMTGFELLMKVKETYPHIKTAVVSAYSDEESRQSARRCGSDAFLTKPLDFKTFQETLHHLMQPISPPENPGVKTPTDVETPEDRLES